MGSEVPGVGFGQGFDEAVRNCLQPGSSSSGTYLSRADVEQHCLERSRGFRQDH